MKTKKQKQIARAPRKMNHKFSRKKPGFMEIQTYGWSKEGEGLTAGVHFVPAITPKIIYQIAESWKRWRKWYDNLPENRNEQYTKGDNLRLATYGAHPLREHAAIKYFNIP
jgi:hypothetical protein